MHVFDAVVIIFPLLCGIMYAASYHISSQDGRLPEKDRPLLAQIIGFAFSQFVFGYVSGLVIMHMRVQVVKASGGTREASTTTHRRHKYTEIISSAC